MSSSEKESRRDFVLERESKGCGVVVFFGLGYVIFDVARQVTSYGVKYYNSDVYPIPHTKLVAIIETVKCVISALQMCWNGELSRMRITALYLLPAAIFSINNNVFYIALTYTTPPIWNVLTSVRLVTLMLTYRFVLGRQVSAIQWTGISIIMSAVILTNVSLVDDGFTGGITNSTVIYIIMCLVPVVLGSNVSSIVLEHLYKNDGLPFSVSQTQVYFFCSAAAWVLYGIEYRGLDTPDMTGDQTMVSGFLLGNIVCSCCIGILNGLVTKKLDNIARLYFNAMSSIFTAIMCATLFSDDFQFSSNYILSLMLVLLGVFAFELKNVTLSKSNLWRSFFGKKQD